MSDAPTVPPRVRYEDAPTWQTTPLPAMARRGMSRLHRVLPEAQAARTLDGYIDSTLFLLAVCAMLLPTTAGFALANAAAQSIAGLPLAIVMFASPFLVIALLPLRILFLALHGLFGIRLRKRVITPAALVCLSVALAYGPLRLSPEIPVTTIAVADSAALPS